MIHLGAGAFKWHPYYQNACDVPVLQGWWNLMKCEMAKSFFTFMVLKIGGAKVYLLQGVSTLSAISNLLISPTRNWFIFNNLGSNSPQDNSNLHG